jgi:hypothetical protein
MFRNPIVIQITQFLTGIGIAVRAGELSQPTFLPGMSVDGGVLVIDESRLRYPGDLLHEAGHLAVMSPEQRAVAGPEMGDDGGFEMAATAWSYAAALHIGLNLRIVFHPDGYYGSSESIIENFGAGRYFGVPILEWLQMTADAKRATELGVPAYPNMLCWLRLTTTPL